MTGFIKSAGVVSRKYEINNLARTYIIRMETNGYLTRADEDELTAKLESIGVSDISLSGSTTSSAGYGNKITLCITGKVFGEFEFVQRKTSTSKQ